MIQYSHFLQKVICLFTFFFGISALGHSQTTPLQNWCGTDQKMAERRADPSYPSIFQEEEAIRVAEGKMNLNHQKGIVYRIPIVFHILHNNGPENVSEEQIMNAVDVINRDFRSQNADTAEVIAQFKPFIGDVEVEFVLAKRAPDGSCFRGYTRTKSPLTFAGDDGWEQVYAVRDGNDVFQGNWPSNDYLNVYIIANAGGAGGYTNYPSNFNFGAMTNGIWLLHTQFGEIGTSSLSAGRSLTHEIGHWYNLKHTWGDSNTPNDPTNCFTDDDVLDTPNCIGNSGGCNLNQNACSGLIANVQNYMDYALSCQSMFTNGQVTRMRSAVISSIGGRNQLWTAANLLQTGIDEDILCKADFNASNKVICVNETVTFTDESFSNVNGWNWSFQGGLPANSIEQNPEITYSTPGIYEVSLTSTDGLSSVSETKIAYITVLDPPSNLPFHDGFEDYSGLPSGNDWFIENSGNNTTWQISTAAANSGSKSARLGNFNEDADNVDELISSSVDLSGASSDSLTFTFRYAYRKRTNSNFESLKVFFSPNCGVTWFQRKTLVGPLLGNIVATSSWTPSPSDWITIHITSSSFNNSFINSNFRYKFQFESDGGNNIYLDDINIYEGAPSEGIVLDITELNNDFEFNVYPNPASHELKIAVLSQESDLFILEIRDLSGKMIYSKTVNSSIGANEYTLPIEQLATGMYLLNINSGNSSKTVHFIKD